MEDQVPEGPGGASKHFSTAQSGLGIRRHEGRSSVLQGASPVEAAKAEMTHEQGKTSGSSQNEIGAECLVRGYGTCWIVDLGVHRALVQLPDGSREEVDLHELELAGG